MPARKKVASPEQERLRKKWREQNKRRRQKKAATLAMAGNKPLLEGPVAEVQVIRVPGGRMIFVADAA